MPTLRERLHSLRNQLQVIGGYLELANQDDPYVQKAAKQIKEIYKLMAAMAIEMSED